MEDFDIKNVIDTKCIKKYKTGFWKAQLNLLEDGRYMIEIYWFPYYLEKTDNRNWHKIYNNESEAEKEYKNVNLYNLRKGDLKNVQDNS